MVQATPAPELHIPHSKHKVDVSIINTTSYVGNLPVAYFMGPPVPGYNTVEAPCYSFLIKHNNPDKASKYDVLLFDLGVRKDWENSPKSIVDQVKQGGFRVEVDKAVADLLRDGGDDPAAVGGIIWSHHHFDHTGDPATFPSSTDLIVGPGFKDAFVPAYPTRPEIAVDESAWKNRNLHEINFQEGNKVKLG